MDQQQLISYIELCLKRGMQPGVINAQLLQSGWTQPMISQAFQSPQLAHAQKPENPHQTRNGILWICSSPILLIVIALVQLIARFSVASSSPTGSDLVILNIISLLLGTVAVVMIPVGLIVGIIKLTKA